MTAQSMYPPGSAGTPADGFRVTGRAATDEAGAPRPRESAENRLSRTLPGETSPSGVSGWATLNSFVTNERESA